VTKLNFIDLLANIIIIGKSSRQLVQSYILFTKIILLEKCRKLKIKILDTMKGNRFNIENL